MSHVLLVSPNYFYSWERVTHAHHHGREWMVWMFERAGKRNPNNTKNQFWQKDNHPIELATNEMMQQKLDYIHRNPVVAGLVLSEEEYLYSSAKNYAGQKDYLLEMLYLE